MTVITLIFLSSAIQAKQPPISYPKRDSLNVPLAHQNPQRSKISEIFQKVEQGIRTNSIDEFEKDLGAIVAIAVGSNERGYFSANQASSVLAGYFTGRRFISFEFTRIYEKGNEPYATGRFMYSLKGNQESAQIYVSLTRQETRWVINQFNIY
jgi:hypothetical protein